MAYTIIIHIQNEDPVMGEMDDLPKSGDTLLNLSNPRRVDGKDLHYLAESVTNVLWPVHRLNFIEIVPTKEEEEIIGFVRE